MTVQFGVDSLCHYCKGMGITRNLRDCLHCSGTGLEPGQKAVARRSDSETSREAAASVTSVRFQQGLILQALRTHGPMHDQAIYELGWIAEAMSPSGARTRRSELVGMGRVEATTQRVTLTSGRSAIVWKAV